MTFFLYLQSQTYSIRQQVTVTVDVLGLVRISVQPLSFLSV